VSACDAVSVPPNQALMPHTKPHNRNTGGARIETSAGSLENRNVWSASDAASVRRVPASTAASTALFGVHSCVGVWGRGEWWG
jgi:hypothetical protein